MIVDSLGALPETTSPGNATSGILIVEIPPYVPKCSGLPTGATCSFSGVQEPYPQDTDLSITVTVPSGIAPGTYPFNVDVESGPADASVGFTLYIGDFPEA